MYSRDRELHDVGLAGPLRADPIRRDPSRRVRWERALAREAHMYVARPARAIAALWKRMGAANRAAVVIFTLVGIWLMRFVAVPLLHGALSGPPR